MLAELQRHLDPDVHERVLYEASLKLEREGRAFINAAPGHALVPPDDLPDMRYVPGEAVAALWRDELRFGEWMPGHGRRRWEQVERLGVCSASIADAFQLLSKERLIYNEQRTWYPGSGRQADATRASRITSVREANILRLTPPGTMVDRTFVWQRDRGRCHLCFDVAPFDDWHLEHVIPLDSNGTNEHANLAVSHPRCNLRKGATWPKSRDDKRLAAALTSYARFHGRPFEGRRELLS